MAPDVILSNKRSGPLKLDSSLSGLAALPLSVEVEHETVKTEPFGAVQGEGGAGGAEGRADASGAGTAV